MNTVGSHMLHIQRNNISNFDANRNKQLLGYELLSGQFLSSLNFCHGQSDRRKVMHKSPPCIMTLSFTHDLDVHVHHHTIFVTISQTVPEI